MQIDSVLIKPLVTEKATQLAQRNVYGFYIHPRATKDQVRTTLETLYKVKVSEVKIAKRRGKVKRVGRKMATKQMPDSKLAYVSLREGTINLVPKA